jgi:hypothetical protein
LIWNSIGAFTPNCKAHREFFFSQELKNSSTQECCDADLGARLSVVLEFLSS